MTATQRRGATWRRAACRAAAALRAIHDEQVLMWGTRLGVQPGARGPGRLLAWTASLDGPRLAGRYLPSPDQSQAPRRP